VGGGRIYVPFRDCAVSRYFPESSFIGCWQEHGSHQTTRLHQRRPHDMTYARPQYQRSGTLIPYLQEPGSSESRRVNRLGQAGTMTMDRRTHWSRSASCTEDRCRCQGR